MVDQLSPPSMLPYTPFGAGSRGRPAINANIASWLDGAKASAMRLMSVFGRLEFSLVHVGVAALALSVRYIPLPQNAHQARFALLGLYATSVHEITLVESAGRPLVIAVHVPPPS